MTETDSETFGYDANGNLICGSRDNLGIVYDPLNQVRSISSDLGQSSFDYAPDGSRYRQVSESQETLYIAKAYERIDDREHKLYVGDYLVITYGGEQAQINYLHKDRLGSVVGISNTASAFSSTRGFNPYGDPRGGEWSENNQDYDVLGNITQKTDYAQDYQYGLDGAGLACTGSSAAPGPNAVTETDSETFGYDANGNLICGSRDNLGIVYDPLNQVRSISSDLGQSSFDYAPDGSRYRQVSESQETLYIAKAYERIDDREHKLYVGDYLVITYGGEQAQINYLHKDRLGSVVGISNTASAFSSTRGFNPYGDPRGGEWSENNQDLDGDELTTRGFTGHEHLERLGLIHMNGRIFNPGLGRFLSPDPIIQFPFNGQSWNAYSYLLNNPMSGTDPSGFTGEFDDDDDGRRIACGFICGPPIGVYGNTSAWFDQVYFDFPSFVENENRIGRDGLGNFVVSDVGNQAISDFNDTLQWIVDRPFLAVEVAQILQDAPTRAGTLARNRVSPDDFSYPPLFDFAESAGDIRLTFNQNGELVGLVNINGRADAFYGDVDLVLLLTGAGPALRTLRVATGRALSGVAARVAAGSSVRAELLNVLRASVRKQAGFADDGVPIVLDTNLEAKGLAEALRGRGYNVRSVSEIFGVDPGDPAISRFANVIGARVLTRDRGRQIGQGFGTNAIQVKSQVKNIDAIIRILGSGL